MFIYKVVSVLISDSVLAMPQFFGQSFASSSITDPSGRVISKSVYTDSTGKVLTDGNLELDIGLLPPFSGEYNDIENKGAPEPIVIIKPPPFTRKTTSYTTAFTTTRTTTRAPTTPRTTTTPRSTTVRATLAPKIIARPPTQQQIAPRPPQFTNTFKSSGLDGKYRAVGESGTYRPKGNTGVYVHNNAGAYRHSNSGAYKPDDRGKYRGN